MAGLAPPLPMNQILNLAVRHREGKWVMVYLGSNESFSINLEKIKGADTPRHIGSIPGPATRFQSAGFRLQG